MRVQVLIAAVLAASVVGGTAVARAQALGSITLPQAVLADGQRVAAGVYELRLTEEAPTPVAGQSPGGARWVELRRDGTVAGREVATLVAAGEIGAIAEGPRPGADLSRVDVLKGGDYVRVWFNRRGTHVILHLPVAR